MFWKLNPKKLEVFAEAFKEKAKFRQEENNTKAWLEGMYITHAIAACFSRNAKYPEYPIELNSSALDQQSKTEAQKFEAYAISFNQEFKKKHGE